MKQERAIVKLSDMQPPKRNVRMHPEKQVKEIIRSLDKFGQCRDIVLDENNVILAGNGLKIAMERRGDTEAAAIRLIGLSEKEKLKFMLADNKTFSLGVEDLDGVNAVLEQLGSELDVPGYDEETLKSILATAEDVSEKLMEYGTINEDEINAIKANAERKDALLEKGKAPEPAAVMETYTEDYPAEDETATTEVRKSVVCPKCGELLWL